MVGPDARIKICLKFEGYTQAIALRLGETLASLAYFGRSTQQVLNVMSNFVRNHIGPCKITSGPIPVGQIVSKGKVDVHAIVEWAIERSNSRCSKAAARLVGLRKQNELRFLIVSIEHFSEQSIPHILGILQHNAHKLRALIFRLRWNIGLLFTLIENFHRVTPEQKNHD